MNTTLIGKWGEVEAAAFLENLGFTIIEAGYHSRFGEIDLIAQKGELIVFVEVKLRNNDHFAKALEAVDRKKVKKIITTAGQWIMEKQIHTQFRFDVIEVYPTGDLTPGTARINHIPNAFNVS